MTSQHKPDIYSRTYRIPDANMFAPKDQPQSALSDSLSATSDFSEKSFLRYHHNSIGDFCSNESSPTTTCYTVDDLSQTDPSPESSPESPPPNTFDGMDIRRESADDQKQSAFFELQKATPPSRKGRNLKNLAVNTTRGTGQPPSLTSIPHPPQQQESAPTILSPAFVRPPPPERRRPSNLGLTILPPSSITSSPKQIRLAIPPTPGFGKPPTLRHFQSSPCLPLVPQLFPRQSAFVLNGHTVPSPLIERPEIPFSAAESDAKYDVPSSREDKPEAYPNGPICVYEPYIDLYLEPTAQQARQYDVVLNVASEVPNPFYTQEAQPTAPDVRMDGGGGIQYAPRRPSTLSAQSDANGSPTTPKATPQTSSFPADVRLEQEYVHIPWEHNSDIVPDLLRLVRLMDDRVQQQKRILVHCQCGVSRSASLVVAYGLYKNPSLSVQEAYEAVKQKSKWIGPNMNLIMQLQEFRSSLARGGTLSGNRGLSPITPTSALSDWTGPFSARANDVGPHAGSLSSRFPPAPSSKSDHFDPSVKSPSIAINEPWSAVLPTGRARAASAAKSANAATSGHVLPVVSVVEVPTTAQSSHDSTQLVPEAPAPCDVVSPRATEFAMTSLTPSKALDAVDLFGIMSPTSTQFPSNPFDRSSLLAQLGMTTHTQHTTPTRARSLKTSRAAEETTKTVASSNGLLAPRRLRPRLSSPTLREQRELQHLQAELGAQLPQRNAAENSNGLGLDTALLSPRATEMTQNPFAMAFDTVPIVEEQSSTIIALPASDPRSPALKGASPIIRNIEDLL